MELETARRGVPEQVDALEVALGQGWQIPGTHLRCVDRATVLELIDQIRVSLPRQVQAAQQLLEQREQLLSAARAEAQALLADAHQPARRFLLEDAFERAAATRAGQIEQQVWRTVDGIERQAEHDAAELLRSLRARLSELDRVLAEQLPLPPSAPPAEPARESFVAAGPSARRAADRRREPVAHRPAESTHGVPASSTRTLHAGTPRLQ